MTHSEIRNTNTLRDLQISECLARFESRILRKFLPCGAAGFAGPAFQCKAGQRVSFIRPRPGHAAVGCKRVCSTWKLEQYGVATALRIWYGKLWVQGGASALCRHCVAWCAVVPPPQALQAPPHLAQPLARRQARPRAPRWAPQWKDPQDRPRPRRIAGERCETSNCINCSKAALGPADGPKDWKFAPRDRESYQ